MMGNRVIGHRRTKSHRGDTEARRKSGNYDFNFRFDILLCSFVSSVVNGCFAFNDL
jgi:hypothetical protein